MENKFPITLIRGENGFGKTVLLGAMSSPFPYDGSFDNRGTASIIRQGRVGGKEIDYVDGKDKYSVNIEFKPNSSGSHSTKCYISKNGIELNPSGNVSSYEPIIESVFGITEKDLMLVRIGTNMQSFIHLSSMDRKKYLSRLIGDVDIYLSMYQMIQSEIRTNRSLISSYTDELNKLNIEDIDYIIKVNNKKKSRVQQLLIDIGKFQSELDSLLDLSGTDVNSLSAERTSIMTKINFLENVPADLKKTSLDTLRTNRKKIQGEFDTTQSKYNELKSNMDANNRGIEFAKIDLAKLTIDDSISSKIESLQAEINSLADKYKGFKNRLTSKEYNIIYQDITSIRTLLQVVVNYETAIIEKIIELYGDATDIDSWYEESMTSIMDPESKINMEQYLKKLLNDGFSIPECRNVNCAYRRLGEMVSSNDTSTMTMDFLTSVRQGIGVFSKAVSLLSKIPQSLPKALMEILDAKNILNLVAKSEVFSIEPFDNFRSVLYGYESYQQKLQQLEVYKQQESSKQRMIIMRGDIEARIRKFNDSNDTLITKVVAHKQMLDQYSESLTNIDLHIGKRIEYDNMKDELPSYNRRIAELTFQIETYSTKQSRIQMIRDSMRIHNGELCELQEAITDTDTEIALYNKYRSEVTRLSKLIVEQEKILRNVSVKEEGIPLVYIQLYFERIRKRCNELLDISYGGTLTLGEFDFDSPEFNIPYIRNGNYVRDIKTGSQGELPMISLALAFAMSSIIADKRYNIFLCDEVDSTFDVVKKYNYLDMMDRHITEMNIEQCLVISHSEALDSIPTNLIDMQEGLPLTRGSYKYKILRG
jgi:hypothetical protein